jgi:hypothetical protein
VDLPYRERINGELWRMLANTRHRCQLWVREDSERRGFDRQEQTRSSNNFKLEQRTMSSLSSSSNLESRVKVCSDGKRRSNESCRMAIPFPDLDLERMKSQDPKLVNASLGLLKYFAIY